MKASFNILLPILSLSESVADRQASGRRSGGRREEEEEEGPRGKMEEGGFRNGGKAWLTS